MAAIPPFYSFGNGDLTGDGTATVTIYVNSTPTYSTTSLPRSPAPPPDEEEELKAITRELRRAESLEAVGWLSTNLHQLTPAPVPVPTVARAKRPTRRRTATATRNFRRI